MIDDISSWIEKNFETPKEALIHYTTEENFKKIQRIGGLLFQSHNVLNYKDKNNHEGTVGFNIIYQKLKKTGMLEHMHMTIEFIKNFILYESISLSEKDSKALIQKYGSKKVCINKSTIDAFVNKKNKDNSENCTILFYKVQYDEEKNIQIVDDFFDNFWDINIFTQDNNTLSHFLMGICFIVPLMKLELDKEEECRIVKASVRSILKVPALSTPP